MKIGVNLRPLFPGKIGGLEHHFYGVFDALMALDTENEYILYVHTENEAALQLRYAPRAGFARLDNPHRVTDLCGAVQRTHPDVVFHPFLFIEPSQLDAYSAVLIPDVRYLHFPEQIPSETLKSWRRLFPETARRADVIFTLSEDSKRDVVERLGPAPDKVLITSPAVEPIFFQPVSGADRDAVKSRHALPPRYLYYPADSWPHKNHVRLLEALALLRRRGMEIPLVLSGYPNAGEAQVVAAIRRLRMGAQVRRLGYVPRADQPALYHLADALVFPSMYEGWGMPVSEAMAAGTPVLCSNRASIPEVGGDAALYFDPLDPEGIADQIARLWTDPSLREKLAATGPAQAAKQTWEKAARTTLDGLSRTARPMLELVDPLPLVSIVTPSFRQGQFIERTIQSVLTQDYPHVEYLVLDGGSDDETVAILKKYGDRIRWISRPDSGQSDAINQGLKAARGEILAYLNSDDTYEPGAIRKAVSHFVAHPSCDIVFGKAWYTDAEDRRTDPFPVAPVDHTALAAACIICQPASFWRRRLHDMIGYFDEDQHLVMDYEFWLRAAPVARFALIDAELATSRLWEGAKTVDSNLRQLYQAMQAVRHYYGEVPPLWLNNYLFVRLQRMDLTALPVPVASRLRRLIRFYLRAKLMWELNGPGSVFSRADRFKYHELHGDGWMGALFEETLPTSHARAIRVRGDLPIWPRRWRRPGFRAFINGRPAGTFQLTGPGPYSFELPVPPDAEAEAGLRLRLEAFSTFIPVDYRIGLDERRLSLRIAAIEAVD